MAEYYVNQPGWPGVCRVVYMPVTPGQSISVTVGSGGAAGGRLNLNPNIAGSGNTSNYSRVQGGTGGASSFGGYSAAGGKGGARDAVTGSATPGSAASSNGSVCSFNIHPILPDGAGGTQAYDSKLGFVDQGSSHVAAKAGNRGVVIVTW